LAKIPLKPNLAKMLILGNKAARLELSLMAAAVLSVEEIFVYPSV